MGYLEDLNTDQRDWSSLRALFPSLSKTTYLNTAGFGPMSTPVAEAAQLYYCEASSSGDGGDVWRARAEECRAGVARLFGGTPQEVAFVHSASMAMCCAALLFEGSGAVLTGVAEHPAVVVPWLSRGFRVDAAEPDAQGRFTVESYARALRPDTRVIAVSHVRFNDGQVNDLRGLGELARIHGAHLVVDASQSMGVLPVHVGSWIDVLNFGCFKWMNAGDGCGVLYVRDGLMQRYGLPLAGNRSRRVFSLKHVTSLDPLLEARAFELGSANLPNIFSLGAAQELVQRIGVDAIAGRILQLTQRFRHGLAGLGLRTAYEPVSAEVTPIVSVKVREPEQTFRRLAEAGVVTSLRDERIRVAISWYNDDDDIDRCLQALASAAAA